MYSTPRTQWPTSGLMSHVQFQRRAHTYGTPSYSSACQLLYLACQSYASALTRCPGPLWLRPWTPVGRRHLRPCFPGFILHRVHVSDLIDQHEAPRRLCRLSSTLPRLLLDASNF